jgi:hypothetical protein
VSGPDNKKASLVLTLLNPRKTYHRASIHDADRIPSAAGAVIVSNHGRLDFDSFILARLIVQARGRLPRILADHMWFKLPSVSRIFSAAGAVDGSSANALELLGDGSVVLAYPGGVREIMSASFGHEHIDWEGRTGFARIAIEAGVPVIPLAGVGVNSGLAFVSSGRLLGRLVFQGLLRLGPSYADYRNPLAVGIIPIPLPLSTAVWFPLPCRLSYYVGDALYPPQCVEGDDIDSMTEEFALQVAEAMWRLIEDHGRPVPAALRAGRAVSAY